MTPGTASAFNSAPTGFDSVDYFVLFIFGLSILAGYIRGFMREVISLITWVVASVVSTMFSGKLAAAFSGTSASSTAPSALSASTGIDMAHSTSMLAIGASFVTLFIGTLVAGYLVSTLITGLVAGSGASLSNRFLGALFGGIRGFILVILLMFIAELTPMGDQPAWTQSSFVKSFQPVVSWIEKMVEPGLQNVRKRAESAVQGATDSMGNASSIFGGVVAPAGQ
jgi:membrane protein required for colicin V production